MTTPPTPKRDPSSWAKPIARLQIDPITDAAMNLNVNGRRLTGPVQGFGQLWQKTYRIQLPNAQVAPEEVIAWWKEHLPDLMPDDSRFYPSLTGVKPGEILLINATLPGIPGGIPVSTGVLILYADYESFSVMTPDGHPESGINTFSSFNEGDATVCQIQSLARANDPMYEFGFRFMGGAAQQERIWRHVLTGVARQFGVDGEVTVKKVCVDSRLQWGQAKNLWHNAVIRTTLALPAQIVRRLLGRNRQML